MDLSFEDFVVFSNRCRALSLDEVGDYLSGDKRAQARAKETGWDTPAEHRRWAQWLEETHDEDWRIFQAYRYGGKSFLITYYVPWTLIREPADTVLILSGKADIAARNTRAIKHLLENNPLTTHLVGDNDLWKASEFSVVRPGNDIHPSCKMLALSGRITGNHAHRGIGDDIETADNCQTDLMREQLWTVVEEFFNCVDKMLFVGTPHTDQTYFSRLRDLPHNWQVYECPVYRKSGRWKGKPAIPELHGEKWILNKKKSMSKGKFDSQYLLIPSKSFEAEWDFDLVRLYDGGVVMDELHSQKRAFRRPEPIFWVSLGEGEETERVKRLIAYWDPSNGIHDDSALAIIGQTERNRVFVQNVTVLTPIDKNLVHPFGPQCEEVLDTCQAHHVSRIFVEDNISKVLVNELRGAMMTRRGVIGVVGVTRTRNKKMMIGENIGPLISTGNLYCHRSVLQTPLREQIEMGAKSRKDDCVDALAGAIAQLALPTVRTGGLDRLTPSPGRPLAPIKTLDYQPLA